MAATAALSCYACVGPTVVMLPLPNTRHLSQTVQLVPFVPLWIFARLLWRRGFVGAVVLGFACSLLIEVTQLTANRTRRRSSTGSSTWTT